MQSTPERSAPPEHVTFGSKIEHPGARSSSNLRRKSPKKASMMEWFDKNVEKELRKRMETSEAMVESFVDPTGTQKPPMYISPRMVQSSTSGIDISERLRSAPDTELTEAVEKLAKAEAASHFAGAVRAAEEAAAAAPPGLAEEAAAAGARGFHAEITDVFHDTSANGEKPIQIIGYVGITRPKKPRRP